MTSSSRAICKKSPRKRKWPAREIAEADKRRADERHQLQEAFMNRQLHPDVKARVSTALRAAAERGETHLRVLTFSSEFCTDGGRAINSGDPNWPKTLVGFAAHAYEFYQKELQPHGYRLRAEILDFPGRHAGRSRDHAVLVIQAKRYARSLRHHPPPMAA